MLATSGEDITLAAHVANACLPRVGLLLDER